MTEFGRIQTISNHLSALELRLRSVQLYYRCARGGYTSSIFVKTGLLSTQPRVIPHVEINTYLQIYGQVYLLKYYN